MTGQPIAPVIPSSGLGGQPAGSGASRVGLRRPPLPLAELSRADARVLEYGVATIDSHGRVADRALIRALGWSAGTRLHVRERRGLLLLDADTQGVFSVSGQGHVVLPAAVRHSCRLLIGDRVLLVADLHTKLLVVYPPEAVDAMVSHLHEVRIVEGDR